MQKMDYFKKYEEWCNSNIFDEKTKKNYQR